MDDDGAQRRFGQVLEQAGQEEDGDEDRCAEPDGGELRLLAGLVSGRGLREAAIDDEGAHQAGGSVGRAKRDQLLVGVDLVAVLARVRTRSRDRFGEAHHDDGDGPGTRLTHWLKLMSGQPRLGRPAGISPMMATPSSQVQAETMTMARPATTSAAGMRGMKRSMMKSSARLPAPSTSAGHDGLVEVRHDRGDVAEEVVAGLFDAEELV